MTRGSRTLLLLLLLLLSVVGGAVALRVSVPTTQSVDDVDSGVVGNSDLDTVDSIGLIFRIPNLHPGDTLVAASLAGTAQELWSAPSSSPSKGLVYGLAPVPSPDPGFVAGATLSDRSQTLSSPAVYSISASGPAGTPATLIDEAAGPGLSFRQLLQDIVNGPGFADGVLSLVLVPDAADPGPNRPLAAYDDVQYDAPTLMLEFHPTCEPLVVRNGSASVSGYVSAFSTVSLVCDNGFEAGPGAASSAFCFANSTWSNGLGECVAVPAAPPPPGPGAGGPSPPGGAGLSGGPRADDGADDGLLWVGDMGQLSVALLVGGVVATTAGLAFTAMCTRMFVSLFHLRIFVAEHVFGSEAMFSRWGRVFAGGLAFVVYVVPAGVFAAGLAVGASELRSAGPQSEVVRVVGSAALGYVVYVLGAFVVLRWRSRSWVWSLRLTRTAGVACVCAVALVGLRVGTDTLLDSEELRAALGGLCLGLNAVLVMLSAHTGWAGAGDGAVHEVLVPVVSVLLYGASVVVLGVYAGAGGWWLSGANAGLVAVSDVVVGLMDGGSPLVRVRGFGWIIGVRAAVVAGASCTTGPWSATQAWVWTAVAIGYGAVVGSWVVAWCETRWPSWRPHPWGSVTGAMLRLRPPSTPFDAAAVVITPTSRASKRGRKGRRKRGGGSSSSSSSSVSSSELTFVSPPAMYPTESVESGTSGWSAESVTVASSTSGGPSAVRRARGGARSTATSSSSAVPQYFSRGREYRRGLGEMLPWYVILAGAVVFGAGGCAVVLGEEDTLEALIRVGAGGLGGVFWVVTLAGVRVPLYKLGKAKGILALSLCALCGLAAGYGVGGLTGAVVVGGLGVVTTAGWVTFRRVGLWRGWGWTSSLRVMGWPGTMFPVVAFRVGNGAPSQEVWSVSGPVGAVYAAVVCVMGWAVAADAYLVIGGVTAVVGAVHVVCLGHAQRRMDPSALSVAQRRALMTPELVGSVESVMATRTAVQSTRREMSDKRGTRHRHVAAGSLVSAYLGALSRMMEESVGHSVEIVGAVEGFEQALWARQGARARRVPLGPLTPLEWQELVARSV